MGEDERKWYVVHTYSGYEEQVKANLEHRIDSMDVADKIFQVVVPTEKEIEVRDGQRHIIARKMFPGYLLVQMKLDEQSWYVVRNTTGVTGFVGSGNRPIPLGEEEVNAIFRQMESDTPRVKVGFSEGENVHIVGGPFADFIGTVAGINAEKGKVRVLLSFFGRETPVELDLTEVQRL
jgi:transcriptional antiterminator NusG